MLKREVSDAFRQIIKQGHVHHTHWKKDDWDTFLIMAPLVWKQTLLALGTNELALSELLPYTLSTKAGLSKRVNAMVKLGILERDDRLIANNMGAKIKTGFYSTSWLNLARFCDRAKFEDYVQFEIEAVRRTIYNRLEPTVKLLFEQLYNNGIVHETIMEDIEPFIGAVFTLVDSAHINTYSEESQTNEYEEDYDD